MRTAVRANELAFRFAKSPELWLPLKEDLERFQSKNHIFAGLQPTGEDRWYGRRGLFHFDLNRPWRPTAKSLWSRADPARPPARNGARPDSRCPESFAGG